MTEVWKTSKHRKYEVSNLGNIRNTKTKRLRSIHYDRNGYARICLMVGKKSKMVMVHKLVADAFVTKERGKTVVNHLDGNKANNRSDNLEWCNLSENTRHMYKNNLGGSKLEYEDVTKIKKMHKTGNFTHKEIAESFGVTRGNITGILNNRVWNY
jgi:hypothetical protein